MNDISTVSLDFFFFKVIHFLSAAAVQIIKIARNNRWGKKKKSDPPGFGSIAPKYYAL